MKTMNRQEALDWLVQNVTKWPIQPRDKRIADDWFWIKFFGGETFAVNVSTDEIITQQQWLDATDNMPHSDCESVFND